MKEKAIKKRIFDSYKKTGELSKKDLEYCEKIDWHPVDELPMKEEHIKEMKRRLKGPFIRINSVEEFLRVYLKSARTNTPQTCIPED